MRVGTVLGLGWALAAMASCGDDPRDDPLVEELPDGVTVSPDGAGYCCPTSGGTCDCAYLGGFLSRPREYSCCAIDAAPPFERGAVDAHGCESVSARGFCNIQDVGPDTRDASYSDAPMDVEDGGDANADSSVEPADASLDVSMDAEADVSDADR